MMDNNVISFWRHRLRRILENVSRNDYQWRRSMDNERQADARNAIQHKRGLRAVTPAASRLSVVHSKDLSEDREFCEGCEFVRLLNSQGVGYCQLHGDIDGRENDPRNHVGQDI